MLKAQKCQRGPQIPQSLGARPWFNMALWIRDYLPVLYCVLIKQTLIALTHSEKMGAVPVPEVLLKEKRVLHVDLACFCSVCCSDEEQVTLNRPDLSHSILLVRIKKINILYNEQCCRNTRCNVEGEVKLDTTG